MLIAIAWAALHGWIVPRIGEFRPQVEAQASRVLGLPVRVGGIAAHSAGLIPTFELSDVTLLDPQGRVALRLPLVVAGLSPRSLWGLGFEQIFIDQPELDIRRAADGRIFVAGLDVSRSSDNDGRMADWFFGQTEFIISRGVLRWSDELRRVPPLALSDVTLAVRNTGRRHAVRIDATPASQWGERFSLRGQFRQPVLTTRNGDWQSWDGQIHADFPRVDVSRLRDHASLDIEVSQGMGAVRAWIDVEKGQLAGATADVSLAGVSTRLATGLQPLALRSVSGRLGGRRLAGGFEFRTQNLQFETHEGQRWPGGNVELSWSQADGRQNERGELRADRLDLDAITSIASHLPLGTSTHALLAQYAPRGLVESVSAKWQGPVAELSAYEARGRVSGLALGKGGRAQSPPAKAAVAAVPGVRGASLDFDLTQAGGRVKLAIRSGAVELPGVFEDPVVPFDDLQADVTWQVRGADLSVTVPSLKFANADAQGEAQLSWRTGDPARPGSRSRFPGVLDLQGSLSRGDGTRVHRYLPLGVARQARDYVREAVGAGTVAAAKFRVRGDLRDFPFADPRQGEFNISADVRNVSYAFAPQALVRAPLPWPALTQLSGELVFDRKGVAVRNASGRFAGMPGLQFKADARIPDLDAITVGVQADVQGPLSESVALVNGSPLSASLGGALARTTASGPADVRLNLQLPVTALDRSKVQGTVTFAANDLHWSPEVPPLTRLRGALGFSERGFQLTGVQARALGGDLRLEGGARAAAGPNDPTLQLRAQGTATAEGLRQAGELGVVSRLARSATGSTAYTASVAVRRGVPEVLLQSSLQGMALQLPAPLAKPAELALPLRYENALTRETLAAPVGTRLQDQMVFELGRLVSASYQRDLTGADPRVLRGTLAVGLAPGESVVQPELGVAASISVGSLNVDAWTDLLEGPAAAAPSGAGVPTSMGYLPNNLALRARELLMGGHSLRNLVLGGSREGLTWRANVSAAELNGYVEYRQPSAANANAGRLYARLARLSIAGSAANEVETILDDQPGSIPALDILVEDFELRGKQLGRLEIDAVNRSAAAGARDAGLREWRLNKLNLSMPEASFTANGNWAAVSAQSAPPVSAAASAPRPARPAQERRRTVMSFKLDINDSGQLLNRLGMKDVIRRGKGRMEGQVSWLGSPLTIDYPSLGGAFNANVESGQFLKADPGLAKLLGVLSLQSLPRRLTLDFRDVFSEGFAFDFVRGDVNIAQGIASTNNLQMKGVNAAVLMEGRADIARETQDLRVVVVPEINAGTASLMASVINPAIGLGTFLAQMVLRQPLIKATTQEFHIEGTWSDPRIARVEARSDAKPDSRSTGNP